MKKMFLLLTLPAFFMAACQDSGEKNKDSGLLPTNLVNNPRSAKGIDSASFNALPTMDFRDTVHDFGKIREGEIASFEFDFTNNGKTPLIISSAIGSCGCTVADFPREPLPPGQSGTIKVQFSSANREGHQEKTVAITTNTGRGTHMLFIKGDVE